MTGCISKRVGTHGDISWRIKYDAGKDPVTGKRIQCYETVRGSKKDSQTRLTELLEQVNKGTHVNPQQRILIREWLEKWLKAYAEPNVSTKTYERYFELLNHHVTAHIGGAQLQKLSAPQIQELYAKLRREGRRNAGRPKKTPSEPQPAELKKGLSERTILHVHRVLSQALSEAMRNNLILSNPCQLVKAPRPNVVSASDLSDNTGDTINALDRDGLSTLLRGLKGHPLFPVATLAAGTGLRRGEILALRWTDVDLDRRMLSVNRAIEDTNLKGIQFKLPKNKSSRRTIGIDQGLSDLLRSIRKRQLEDSLRLGRRLPSDALIFSQSVAEPLKPIRPMYVTDEFSKLARRLGFQGFRFHDLRHTHATLLLTDGVPVNAVAQRLGHSTPVITLNTYGHVLRRAEEQAASVAGSLIADALAD